MKPPQIFTILALVLLSAFAHAAKTGGATGGGDEPAPRIAVYLDCSGSMAPYLEAVEAEVRKQFPDADVFKVPAIKVWVDGTVVRGGVASVLPHKPAPAGPRVSLDPSRLSPTGKEILARYAGNFEVGSVGAWVDILRTEKRYDALVIFSDFNDQVLQLRSGRLPHSIFSPRVIRPVGSCRSRPMSRAESSRSSTGFVPTARLSLRTEACS